MGKKLSAEEKNGTFVMRTTILRCTPRFSLKLHCIVEKFKYFRIRKEVVRQFPLVRKRKKHIFDFKVRFLES